MDRVGDLYQGKARVVSVDIFDPAGAELGQKYGAGSESRAIVFFTRDGGLDVRAPTITESEAVMILDRLLQ